MSKRKWLIVGSVAALVAVVVVLLACTRWPASPITRKVPDHGVKEVVFRASLAERAVIISDPKATAIEVTGTPEGGSRGYHPPDFVTWLRGDAHPSEVGLDFVSARHGGVLVVSTEAEYRFLHHAYFLRNLRVLVPADVKVVRQPRKLTENLEPDLSPP
jgi:hypothetical protein